MQPYAMLHLLLAAIVMASSSKKALVNKVRCVVGTHGITDSTLAAVLEKLKTHQDILDETWSKRRLSKIALEIMGRIGCVETLPYAEGDGQFQWHFAEPTRLVAVMVEECPVMQSIFEERLAVHPLSRLLLGIRSKQATIEKVGSYTFASESLVQHTSHMKKYGSHWRC